MNPLLPSISTTSFVSSAFMIGLLLRNDLTMNEQNAVGEWFSLIATTLQTNAAWIQVLTDRNTITSQTKNDTNDDTDKDTIDFSLLKKVLTTMQKEIDTLKNTSL